MLDMNKPAAWWGHWPVVQQPLEVLEKGVLVLVNEAHHRVAGKEYLEHSKRKSFQTSLFDKEN